MYPVQYRKDLAPNIVLMRVLAPRVAKKALPGQFIILRVDEEGERIPLTVADKDPLTGEVSIIFQVVGASTMQLNALQPGDCLADFAGPLGRPSEFFGAKRVLCIGGGVGTAVVYPQVKYLHSKGVSVDVIEGARNSEYVLLEQELRENCDRLYLATDDGSRGQKGFVTDVIRQLLDSGEKYDLAVAIGPMPMMRAVCALTRQYGLRTMVSLNPIMVDGTGMCGCCRVTVGGQMKYACVDGPDFDGHEVDFEDIMTRMKLYAEQEGEAKDRMLQCGGQCHGRHE